MSQESEPESAESAGTDTDSGGTPLSVGKFAAHALPLLAWLSLIVFLSLQEQSVLAPYISPLSFIPHADKLLHFCEYAILCVLASRFVHMDGRWLPPKSAMVAATLFCAFFAVFDEALQGTVSSRDASSADWQADALGACLGSLAWALNLSRLAKAKSSRGTDTSPKSAP